MKQLLTLLAAALLTATTSAQVGIGTTTPDASSALDITSTTKGLLIPRMKAAERDVISSAATGLMIFCTDCASGEGELQVKLTSSWKNIIGGDVNDLLFVPEVGDFYQGGVVFYIFVDGDTGYIAGQTHGLIAAVKDQNTSIPVPWQADYITKDDFMESLYELTGAIGTAIGTGSTNTTTIIGVLDDIGERPYAAGIARAYNGGGFDDWFLPSKLEINKMRANRATINITAAENGGSDFWESEYWSSTEIDINIAFAKKFYNGNPVEYYKSTDYYVRAIRAF